MCVPWIIAVFTNCMDNMLCEHCSYQTVEGARLLNKHEFEVLRTLSAGSELSQRAIAAATGISLGAANKAHKGLRAKGLIGSDGGMTPEGMEALEPYRVHNAVILAAGSAVRMAPFSYERPKAMLEVRGEVLIERLIRQLHEAGIRDITVVVGYMKESFFYLEDEFGVNIIVNPDYAVRNNHASLYCARNVLGSTYVCSSDQYYAHNIFNRYEYRSCCTACFAEAVEGEYVLSTGPSGLITGVERSGSDVYFARGPAYFTKELSTQMIDAIRAEYDEPGMAQKLWDDVLAEHIGEMRIYMRAMEPDTIFEFDYLTDLAAFDADFFANVDSKILDNITATLGCARSDIVDVVPMCAGLTNLSTLFAVRGVRYVYRHPGNGTEEIINRRAEAYALEIARDLGLDDTFVYEDPDEGWKISRYVEGCSDLDYADRDQVERALRMARLLHTSGRTSPWNFDFHSEGVRIVGILKDKGYPLPRDFDALAERIAAVAAQMKDGAGNPVLCHNDFYGPNFLVRGDEMRLIDWEYAAMGDPACDIGNFVAQGSGYSVEETLGILPLYFGRPATPEEERHCLAAVGVVGWYWYVWAMYKEAMGNPVGEWLYIWYRAAKQFGAAAAVLYGME